MALCKQCERPIVWEKFSAGWVPVDLDGKLHRLTCPALKNYRVRKHEEAVEEFLAKHDKGFKEKSSNNKNKKAFVKRRRRKRRKKRH